MRESSTQSTQKKSWTNHQSYFTSGSLSPQPPRLHSGVQQPFHAAPTQPHARRLGSYALPPR